MSRVLVTGAGGFSGSHIVTELVARGHEVTALVRNSSARLSDVAGRFAVIRGDLAQGVELPEKLDAIVHAAATSAWDGVTGEMLTNDNVVATRQLLRQAKASGARKLVFLSSLSVYGSVSIREVCETTPPSEPDAYGAAKLECERMIAAEAGWLSSLSIRLPGVIGRGSVRNWLTGVLTAAREGREITLYNAEFPFNNAVHVDDLARFVAGLIEREWKGADVVTIGAAGRISVGAAVRLIADAFGGKSPLRVEAAPRASFLISSARAIRRYGYAPMEIGAMLRRFAAENT